MIRLSGLSLLLDHEADALPAAICARLGVEPADLRGFTIYRRGNDARRRNAILLVYTVDVDLAHEGLVLERFAGDKDVRRTPDMEYRFVAKAPEGWSGLRPAFPYLIAGAVTVELLIGGFIWLAFFSQRRGYDDRSGTDGP